MSGTQLESVAVVGASSQIGIALLPRLAARGICVHRVGRERSMAAEAPVHVFDEGLGCFDPALDAVDALISLAPLPSIALVLRMARCLGARRVIAFGSTGRYSKRGSTSAIERDFVVQQEEAEQVLVAQSKADRVDWTLLRPTMVYGANADLNVAFIRTMVLRFGFFPMPVGAHGLRQPVHVDDLASACVSVLDNPQTFDRAYDLGGGETIDFPALVRRVFDSEGKKPLLLPVPRVVYYFLIAAAKMLPAAGFVRKEMVDRMFQDLVADNRPAFHDFGYKPRGFAVEQPGAA